MRQIEAKDKQLEHPSSWQQAQRILEVLADLGYRAGDLKSYLRNIASGLSTLLELDWTVITLCQSGRERVMASSLDLGEGEQIYSLHGTLTATVVETGQTLRVEDANSYPELGKPPEGYVSYLGIPLRTLQGEVIGTICSFSVEPRQFTVDEIRTAELFAERAATAIDNYNLYQQLQQFNQALAIEVTKRTEELKAAQAKLIEQERLAAIGEFAATIVHEIRNPLTTVLMGLNYFDRICQTERDRARASLAQEEANRLQNLLSEILLYAKPQNLQAVEIEIDEFVEKTLISLREMPEALDRKIELIPSSSDVKILGDKDKLKQILINLVRNACEAIAPQETVTCKVELIPQLSQVCLSVRNGGTPIPADILPKLTQPFCSTKPNGTGLGLAIVKRIIDAHGGRLAIQSDEVTGTTVSVILPLVPANSTCG